MGLPQVTAHALAVADKIVGRLNASAA
jgi:hypothetical protein